MNEAFTRTIQLIGEESVNRLAGSRVILFGVGGVGSFAAEALCRAGIGHISLVDGDTVAVSNLNRQLVALTSTVGQPKAEVMRRRMLDINPSADVRVYNLFYDASTADQIDLSEFDYVVDAIDSVSSKLLLIECCHSLNIPCISCMGAGNKLDPTQFEVADISKTSVCPLARVMRRELKNRGIHHHKVVYSKEAPVNPTGERTPASISFVPSAAGLILAGAVIRDIIQK
ncbi:MAG: tRNA threonylcarbamoyladenosine dehydratase [Clostridia bacterium]|nr:tRNA threonylcarbamoyladenosine dehydratase [Clostridia bacterium]